MKTKKTTIFDDLHLGDITETKKLFLLDEINALLTHRIVHKLISRAPTEKRQVFIDKINANKDNPDKILLFIDHFVENAEDIITDEIEKCKKELQNVLKKQK